MLYCYNKPQYLKALFCFSLLQNGTLMHLWGVLYLVLSIYTLFQLPVTFSCKRYSSCSMTMVNLFLLTSNIRQQDIRKANLEHKKGSKDSKLISNLKGITGGNRDATCTYNTQSQFHSLFSHKFIIGLGTTATPTFLMLIYGAKQFCYIKNIQFSKRRKTFC